MTSEVTETYGISNMPPSARACLPGYVKKEWPKAFERFHKYVSGGIESHRKYINDLDKKRMELWSEVKDRERRLSRGKVGETEIEEAIRGLSHTFRHSLLYLNHYTVRSAIEREKTIEREVRKIIKDPTRTIRNTIEKLGEDIQAEQDEIYKIQNAPESIVPLMSWLDWFKRLDYGKMRQEICRLEGANNRDGYPPTSIVFGSGKGYKEQNY